MMSQAPSRSTLPAGRLQCGNWLRASNYYRCAELFMDAKDPRRELLLRSMRRCPDLGERVMRMSSSLVAPSAVVVLSTALLCGPSGTAMSQTQLPSVTIEAPKQVARPNRPVATPQGYGR